MTEGRLVGKYRKKQEMVEAIRWTGDNIEAVRGLLAPYNPDYRSGDVLLALPTGFAKVGDWIIRPGRHMTSEAFHTCYEPVESSEKP